MIHFKVPITRDNYRISIDYNENNHDDDLLQIYTQKLFCGHSHINIYSTFKGKEATELIEKLFGGKYETIN